MADLLDETPLTVADVARRLRIAHDSVYRLCTRGKLTAYKVGGVWRIWPKDVAAYLESRRHRPRHVPSARESRPSQGVSGNTLARLRAMGMKV